MFGIKALALLPLLPGAHAHGYLRSPSPRNCEGNRCTPNLRVRSQGPFCGNYEKGQPVVTFTAGQTIDVEWTVVINHRGSYKYQICRDGSDTEECFKQNSLKNDQGQVSVQIPGWARVMKDTIRIPDDLTCDSCTLAWVWDDAQRTKWANCADIAIIKKTEDVEEDSSEKAEDVEEGSSEKSQDVEEGSSESASGEDVGNAGNATGEAFISAASPHVVSPSLMLAVILLSVFIVTPTAQS